MADSISDFLTVIRNASLARKDSCTGRYSRLHLRIAEILKEEGYVRDVAASEAKSGMRSLTVTLKYVDGTPAISGISRMSRPGRRLYYSASDIPRVLGGLGIAILTTSQGIMKDREARKKNVGGEVLCSVW